MRESIQFRLSFWLTTAIIAVAILAGAISIASAYEEAQEIQDNILLQIASFFDPLNLPVERSADDSHYVDFEEDHIFVQYLAATNISLDKHPSNASVSFPNSLLDGLQTIEVSGEKYRVNVKTIIAGKRIVVAQPIGMRDEITFDTAMLTLTPLIILVPIFILIIMLVVKEIFRPIRLLAAEVEGRNENELHPLEVAHIPKELKPFTVAINDLLSRVLQSVETQRRFLADAAHELKSPLTALSLQAERLANAEMSEQANIRLSQLRLGIERGRNLLNQLLTLARVQSVSSLPVASISVLHVYRRVLEDLMPLIEAKQLDIGVEGTEGAHVQVSELDLLTLVRNLVDNAIRYSPERSRIDLSLRIDTSTAGEYAILQIKDSGPGIPVNEQEHVFDPFYRVLGSNEIGSGLGLSIVKTIADRIGAKVSLSFTDEVAQLGLCVTLALAKGSN